jgi:hypothetical protein
MRRVWKIILFLFASEHLGIVKDTFDLTNWSLQTVQDNKVVFVNPVKFESPYFYKTDNGYVMTALDGWPTTKNSNQGRTEFRELNGTKGARWDMTFGQHYLDFSISIPTSEKLIFGQIKAEPGPAGGPLKLWSQNGRIWAQQGPHNGKSFPLVGTGYTGQRMNFKIRAGNGTVTVQMNSTTIEFSSLQQDNYFKVGNYYHGRGTGSILLHSLNVRHTV